MFYGYFVAGWAGATIAWILLDKIVKIDWLRILLQSGIIAALIVPVVACYSDDHLIGPFIAFVFAEPERSSAGLLIIGLPILFAWLALYAVITHEHRRIKGKHALSKTTLRADKD